LAPWAQRPLGLRRLSGSATSPVGLYVALGRCYGLLGSIASPALLSPTRLYHPLDSAITSQAPSPLGLCYQAMLSPLGLYHLSGSAIASRALSPLGLYHLSGSAIASRSLSPLRLGYRFSGSAASRALPLPFRPYPLWFCPPTDQVTPNELSSAYQAARRARPTGTIGGLAPWRAPAAL